MYLKRVVLSGFKSFADRTEFEFGRGITGIVGPNGCGKSNVVDAVRWVLGEQSARSLRGTRMLDVVFAGSPARTAADAALVELTFDNTTHFLERDEPEITVSRTLFRSGESEYKLNGENCRLKDVRDLLLDTGVAVSAYSIIEQGRVDVLLHANPKERRVIFEEAAGISRYRARRLEAQRKLERTQNNLLRLNDVIEELERQLRSVKLAAGKARNFQEYDNRLRELRSAFSLAEYHDLEQARQQAGDENNALTKQVAEQRHALAESDGQLASRERELRACEDELQSAEAALVQLNSESSALAERRAQFERRLSELAETRERRAGQASEVASRLQAVEQRLAGEEAALRELASEEGRYAGRVSELEDERRRAAERCDEAQAALDSVRSAAFEAARRATLIQNQCAYLEQQRERLAGQLERLTQRAGALRDEQAQLTRQREELETAAAELDRRITELTERVRSLDARLDQLNIDRAQLDARMATLKESRAATTSRLGVLEDMEKRLEGVEHGTRRVLEWAANSDEPHGILGLVADLLRIDDPRLPVVQPVLAAFEDRLVARDTATLLEALERCAPLNGPVRAFVLERLPEHGTERPFADMPGVIACVADWVVCDEQHRRLAEQLLGKTLVVETRDQALALATQAPADYVLVTLDGDVVTGDGQLTVGTARAEAGLFSRKTEIRQLQVQLDDVETQLEQAARSRRALESAISDAQVQRESLLNDVAEQQQAHAEKRAAVARREDEWSRAQRELDATAGELAHLNRSLEEMDGERKRLESEQAAADQEQREHEARIGELEERRGEVGEALAELSQRLTQALVEAGRSKERRAAAEEALRELHERLRTLGQQRESAANEAREAHEAIETAKSELQATEQRERETSELLQQRRGGIDTLRQQRQTLRSAIDEQRTAHQELQTRIDTLEEARHEQHTALREIEVRRESLVSRVAEDLSIDLATLYHDYEHAEQDWAAIKAEIEQLRQKITRLGNVNLDAIQELEELAPRHESLQSQRQDLLDSILQLETLIADLDQESRTRFASSFEEIRKHFQDLFRKLFGGGKADIILEDPEEPLECGIEIIARPPGKEPQTLSLLSGGEKTMAAVALLLAVFKSKPSPFAILDEVDAALDESNVGRFNTVVQEFVEHSQFVVVTHNKRTMQNADMLYGVTMEETGVSKRVSVRFDERVDTPTVA